MALLNPCFPAGNPESSVCWAEGPYVSGPSKALGNKSASLVDAVSHVWSQLAARELSVPCVTPLGEDSGSHAWLPLDVAFCVSPPG